MVRMLRVGHRRILLLLVGMCGVAGDMWQKSNRRGGVLLNVIAFHLCCRLVGGKSYSTFKSRISTYGHHIRYSGCCATYKLKIIFRTG
jgi:hypothetical protein